MIDTVMTGQRALEELQSVGFVLDRVTDRVYVKRGAMKFTLPKGDELCNQYLNSILHGVIKEIREKTARTGAVKLRYTTPLMVSYRSVPYAVVQDLTTRLRLQDLDSGRRFEVLKSQVQPYEVNIEIPPKEEKMVGIVASENGGEEVKVETPKLTPMSNPTDMAALIRLTLRRIETLRGEYLTIQARLRGVAEKYDATSRFLRTLGVEEIPPLHEEAIVAREPSARRVRPTDSHNTRVLKDRMLMAWNDLGKPTGYGYMQRIKDRLKTQGLDLKGVRDQDLYRIMKEIR
jgi:hypothetical protein